MSTYLRRLVVPYEDRGRVVSRLRALFAVVNEENVLINKKPYTIFKFISAKPCILQKETLTLARNGTLPTRAKILQAIYASDLDIRAAIVVDQTDFAALDETTAAEVAVTIDITDIEGIANSLEFAIHILDATIAVITLTATAIDIEDQNVAAFDPTANIASAVDDGDDVSASVVITFKEDDADGADIFDTDYAGSLVLAKTHLGTETNKVFVMYNYTDGSGNLAAEKTATWTAIADT